MDHPLVLTLKLDQDLATKLTALRTKHFPPERNFLDAHVTLFHALPGARFAEFAADVAVEAVQTRPFAVRVSTVYSLGRGVALEIEAAEIAPLRRRLRDRWLEALSPQDQTPNIRPHVTVQNKVSGEIAASTLASLRATWDSSTTGRAVGLSLYEYRGGPWTHVCDEMFQE